MGRELDFAYSNTRVAISLSSLVSYDPIRAVRFKEPKEVISWRFQAIQINMNQSAVGPPSIPSR